MLNGLKIYKQESYWSKNLPGLFKVFLNKATATKYCFQVFQFFFNEFIDCIDEPYIISGLRALASHHALLLKNEKLWYHTIRTTENEDVKLTWEQLFDEFRHNLHTYIDGRMFSMMSTINRLVLLLWYEYIVVRAQANANKKEYDEELRSFLWRNSAFRDWQAFVEVYYMGNKISSQFMTIIIGFF